MTEDTPIAQDHSGRCPQQRAFGPVVFVKQPREQTTDDEHGK
jgi:hypothetical protein